MSSDSNSNKKKQLSQTSVSQIQILSAMAEGCPAKGEPKRYQIMEIAEMSGLKEEKDTLRYLYILEGQKLVAPYPPGDFTARVWNITQQGLEALKHISKSMAA